ncbi:MULTISPECIES: hypothetical protein [Pelosinus]|uniref:Uncharacterized protein n=1 Tax=Pelosinus fermentans B4 TaxID=1149862 RepID=I9LHS0_9FIRM|nr:MULTISPECIES: hypothetical protein [Pelosinus]EIW19931.1 hypothetical protein FB4_0182 [Pelosinus fermentans B4]EIW21212.1 hypothetical protein FA11_0939 [Pelosinus fermentans A11]
MKASVRAAEVATAKGYCRMVEAVRQSKFAEIAKLISHKIVDAKFVADAWEWKKEHYGEEHADKLLDEQLVFEQKRRGLIL